MVLHIGEAGAPGGGQGRFGMSGVHPGLEGGSGVLREDYGALPDVRGQRIGGFIRGTDPEGGLLSGILPAESGDYVPAKEDSGGKGGAVIVGEGEIGVVCHQDVPSVQGDAADPDAGKDGGPEGADQAVIVACAEGGGFRRDFQLREKAPGDDGHACAGVKEGGGLPVPDAEGDKEEVCEGAGEKAVVHGVSFRGRSFSQMHEGQPAGVLVLLIWTAAHFS